MCVGGGGRRVECVGGGRKRSVSGWVGGGVCVWGCVWGGGGSSWILASCQPHRVTSRGRDGGRGDQSDH